MQGVRIVGIDSSEPDLNEGKVGRVHYDWIRREFESPSDLKVFVLHHHLLPIPAPDANAARSWTPGICWRS